MNPAFTAVMVTKDRPRLLAQTVRSLYAHTGAPFRLVVIDDCSGPAGSGMLRNLQALYKFDVIRNPEPTALGASKNKALGFVDDGLVYVTDNDVFFQRGWWQRLALAWTYRPQEIKVLAAGCHQWLGTNRTASVNGYEYHYKDALSGWSWLMDIETWREFGPLDGNALGSGQSEDWAFCQRVKQGGHEVASVWPELVIHCGRTNTEGQPAVGAETIRPVVGVLVE